MSEPQKRIKVFYPLLFSIFLAAGIFLGFKLRDIQGYKHAYILNPARESTIQEILNLTRLKYVDSAHVKDLKNDAIQAILAHLDPHSVYIPASELAQVNENLEGSFQGIGVEYIMLKDTINITDAIPGGPAALAGIEVGDKLLAINDSSVAGVHITTSRIKDLLRGPKGSKVNISILRNDKVLPFAITRAIIPLPSIDASYMITPDIGYIRINRFAANTYPEFMDAMLKLQKEGLKKLVIDLRQNSGGYLDAAVNVADELLSDNKLIVYTEGAHYPRQDYTCNKAGVFEKGPLTILVDGGTASASEILAGAVQDWDRGTIIGRRTFGKGLVQEQYSLDDGGALRLTVARYYIPSGRCIQRPYTGNRSVYFDDILERYQHGELTYADSIHFTDTTHYYTKIKHRRVYGGGGIMPDVFVPIDTTRLDTIMLSLYAGSTIFDFAFRYFNQHKNEFGEYKNAVDFVKNYQVSPTVMQSFQQYTLKWGITGVKHLGAANELEVATRIKAFFARELWQLKGYYMVMNTRDNMVERALQEMGE
ncbi:MAG: S41 family peptidase [Chitinophagaceae bacterium]|nr:MAG: S41 family peptidase [Chitinophagaceae bacterium]